VPIFEGGTPEPKAAECCHRAMSAAFAGLGEDGAGIGLTPTRYRQNRSGIFAPRDAAARRFPTSQPSNAPVSGATFTTAAGKRYAAWRRFPPPCKERRAVMFYFSSGTCRRVNFPPGSYARICQYFDPDCVGNASSVRFDYRSFLPVIPAHGARPEDNGTEMVTGIHSGLVSVRGNEWPLATAMIRAPLSCVGGMEPPLPGEPCHLRSHGASGDRGGS
jgi:hypothetical protein